MTLKERTGAAKALYAWFRSQDISPGDASTIMIDMLAIIVAETATRSGDDEQTETMIRCVCAFQGDLLESVMNLLAKNEPTKAKR